MRELTVSNEESGRRADKYLLKYLICAPRSFVYKTLRKKNVKLNGRPASGDEILAPGDIIKLYLSDDTIEKFSSGHEHATPLAAKIYGPLAVVYEDENILICDKPAGLLSQPAGFFDGDSLAGRVAGYLAGGEYDPEKKSTFAPALSHRLDRNTSGLVVAAKNLPASQAAAKMIRERKIEKIYLAAVAGKVIRAERLEDFYYKDERSNTGVIVKKTGDKIAPPHTGRLDTVVTEYKPLLPGDLFSVIEARLVTGKSHQIRAHMKSAGHPVVGDVKYGDKNLNGWAQKKFGVRRQMLHAWKLKFVDCEEPLSYLNGREFTAEPPDDLQKLIEFNK